MLSACAKKNRAYERYSGSVDSVAYKIDSIVFFI